MSDPFPVPNGRSRSIGHLAITVVSVMLGILLAGQVSLNVMLLKDNGDLRERMAKIETRECVR